jgi:predicted ATPase
MLKSITIEGFKSIKQEQISLGALNVLIGANGSGKSNFISFFRFIQQMTSGSLQEYVGRSGGADALLYYGAKTTEQLAVSLLWSEGKEEFEYKARLVTSTHGRLVFREERISGPTAYKNKGYIVDLGGGQFETRIPEEIARMKAKGRVFFIANKIVDRLSGWRVYHFHDTSSNAKVKLPSDVKDNSFLKSDASNLAPYLYWLREVKPEYYSKIVRTVRLAAPFFKDFHLRLDAFGGNTILLEWLEQGSDTPFGPDALSDGTLRFICLATLLQQPTIRMPSTILIDEPELGLHPYAIILLAGMLQSIATERQVIVSTQSVPLVNQFNAEELIVVNREGGESKFQRLNILDLEAWMGEYALGELWEKNLLGGRPSR